MSQDNNIVDTISQDDFVFNNSSLQRTINEIAEYLAKNNNRTLHEEYNLVMNKKSGLSKRLRDMVIMLIETEKMVEQDEQAKESVDKTEQLP